MTELSERTIRFYEQELLIRPDQTRINGRSFREYSQVDVDALLTIARLRKAFFTIQDIRDMLQDPKRIPAVLQDYKQRSRQEILAKKRIVDALDHLNIDDVRTVDSLSASLRTATMHLSLPKMDAQPNFGRLDGISKDEREQEYQAFLEREEHRLKTGRIIVIAIAGINILTAIAGSLISFNLFSLLIQSAASIALINRVRWVKYVFIVGSALSVMVNLAILIDPYRPNIPPIGIVLGLLNMIFAAASCILLVKSRSVELYFSP